jgi:hypothetical protein
VKDPTNLKYLPDIKKNFQDVRMADRHHELEKEGKKRSK